MFGDTEARRTETRYRVGNGVASSDTVITLPGGERIEKHEEHPCSGDRSMRYFVETYGCTMNFGEGRRLSEDLASLGYEEVFSADDADIVVLNTCTVVGTTEKHMIDRLSELKHMGKETVVTGCLAAAQPRRVEIRLPDAPILPPRRYGDFRDLIIDRYGVAGPPRQVRHQKNAILPIAQGCLGSCTYCITRIARGALSSYPPQELRGCFGRMVDEGASEILLTAQDTACYGRDIGSSLPGLLSLLLEKEGDYRVRIGMMNPNALLPICDALLDVMEDPRVYRFLHIPVQSASDDVLGRMGRGYGIAVFESLVSRLRERCPGISIATDVICGFPGESDADHRATAEMIRRLRLDTVNITRFSPRPGTPAADMEQVHGRISHGRSVELTGIKNATELDVNTGLVGRRFRALSSEKGKEGTVLRTDTYRPVVVRDDIPVGEFREVEITDARPTYLIGRTVRARACPVYIRTHGPGGFENH